MSESAQPVVRRVRRATTPVQEVAPLVSNYHGFGSIPGENPEEFHERMFDIDPLEAMIYEMEFALGVAG